MNLSEETIRACTNDKSYQRGYKYYQQGRVVNFSSDAHECRGAVIGTGRYSVNLDISNLSGRCDCYAFEGSDMWCKHIVAVALYASLGAISADQEPKVKGAGSNAWSAGTAELLADQPHEALVGIIQTLIERYPDARNMVSRVISPPSVSSPSDILTAVKQALAPVKRAKTWHRQVEANIQAREDIESIAAATPASEDGLRGLLGAATWLYKQLEHLDDSDGELQGAAGVLVSRSVEIANAHHQWLPRLYEPLQEPTDLPLVDIVLSEGNQIIRDNFISRLDKHRYTRDNHLTAVSRDQAESILLHYYATHGDRRLLELIDECKMHDRYRLSLLLNYHRKRSEWNDILRIGWPHRKEHYTRAFLQEAAKAINETEKIVALAIMDTVESHSPVKSLQKLEYILKQYNKSDKLEGVIQKLLAGPHTSVEHKLELLIKLERFDDVVGLSKQTLQKPPLDYRYQYASPYAYVDIIADIAEQLTLLSPEHGRKVWRALFTQEVGRVVKSSNYSRFELYGKKLIQLGDNEWLQPLLKIVLQGYPTRKKLVAICQQLAG